MPKKTKTIPTTMELAQIALIDRLHKHVRANTDTWVPAGVSGEIVLGDRTYLVGGGERMWLEHKSTTIFYVTLENQNVQVKVEVLSDGALLSKRPLGESGSVGARPRRAVSHSS